MLLYAGVFASTKHMDDVSKVSSILGSIHCGCSSPLDVHAAADVHASPPFCLYPSKDQTMLSNQCISSLHRATARNLPIGSVHRRLYFLLLLKWLGVEHWEKKSGSIQRIATAAVFNWGISHNGSSEHTNPCLCRCSTTVDKSIWLMEHQCLTSRLSRQQQCPWPEDLDEVSVLLLCSARPANIRIYTTTIF